MTSRNIHRDYLPTPELLTDGTNLPTVPVSLAVGDWDGLRRILEQIRKAILTPIGTITGRIFRTAVSPDKRVEIDTKHGIRIFNDAGILTAQFNGDELTLANGTITGGTIIGSTFETAASPADRITIDSTNGLQVFRSGSVVATLSFTPSAGSYFEVDQMSANAVRSPSFISLDPVEIASDTQAEIFIDGTGATGIVDFYLDSVIRMSIETAGITMQVPLISNAQYVQMTEQTAPSAGAANTVRIYAQDNGAGKTQLMALFSSGAAQQIAIQP